MTSEQKILVMAGSREAHALVTALLARRREVIASLPEPERMFDALPVPTRLGKFASADRLRAWLIKNHVAAVMDASHTFDEDISALAGRVCTRLKLPYLRILRPPWVETPRDRWHHVPSIADAVRKIPANACVFTNTGFATLPEYAEFAGKKLYMRQTHPESEPAPFSFVEYIEGQPPFSQFQEERLFRQLNITHLICRNVGGAASMSKLLAARAMSIPVYLIERRPMADHLSVVGTVAEALEWEANR